MPAGWKVSRYTSLKLLATSAALGGAFAVGFWFRGADPASPDGGVAGPPVPSTSSEKVVRVTVPNGADSCKARVRELEQQVADLQQQVKFGAHVLDNVQQAAEGMPVQWPADYSGPSAPDEYPARFNDVVARCDPEARVVDVDCGEPPCLGIVRVSPADTSAYMKLVNNCAPWSEVYGNEVSSATGSVVCPDGHRESYLVLGVPPSVVLGSLDEQSRANSSKRMQARLAEIQESWTCAE